ncbi:MAG: F0F1 ATP synthase subunit B [wastewater metagenome]|nr:F0F1 ATP synthase subunit B [Candidatus Loosdrechtia aerotolerans]
MEIDLFTLVAQIINFIILVVVLKYLLYNRITKVMDERQERIASQLKEAEQKKKEAEQNAELHQKKLKELDSKREEMLAKIREEAESQRKELIQKASDEVKDIRDKWYESIQREKQTFMNNLRMKAGKEVFAIARRSLTDLANADLGRQIADVFLERIQKLDECEKQILKESVRKSEYEVDISSAFEIPQEIRQKMVQEIRDQIASNVHVQFKISSDLICGIELVANGRKIAWSLNNYLHSLEESLSSAIEEKIKRKQDEIQEE